MVNISARLGSGTSRTGPRERFLRNSAPEKGLSPTRFPRWEGLSTRESVPLKGKFDRQLDVPRAASTQKGIADSAVWRDVYGQKTVACGPADGGIWRCRIAARLTGVGRNAIGFQVNREVGQ